jgi:hypothetical protein
MAKKSVESGSVKLKVKIRRKGVHAKSKSSVSKNSKNYKKLYKAQGR